MGNLVKFLFSQVLVPFAGAVAETDKIIIKFYDHNHDHDYHDRDDDHDHQHVKNPHFAPPALRHSVSKCPASTSLKLSGCSSTEMFCKIKFSHNHNHHRHHHHTM